MRRAKVPAYYFDESVAEAAKYRRQAERLFAALKRTEAELGEELFRLQSDLRRSQEMNARLLLENAELSFQLAEIKGEA